MKYWQFCRNSPWRNRIALKSELQKMHSKELEKSPKDGTISRSKNYLIHKKYGAPSEVSTCFKNYQNGIISESSKKNNS